MQTEQIHFAKKGRYKLNMFITIQVCTLVFASLMALDTKMLRALLFVGTNLNQLAQNTLCL